MDFEVERCTRRCAVTDRQLAEGEEFFSALVTEAGHVHRRDFSTAAWQGPPEGALGWWKSKMPTATNKKAKLAPSEVLLQLFAELESAPDRRDMLYVLALLMVRRRIFKMEDTLTDERGQETLVLYCPRDESTHHVAVAMPNVQRAEEIQQELSRLLFAGEQGKADSGKLKAESGETTV